MNEVDIGDDLNEFIYHLSVDGLDGVWTGIGKIVWENVVSVGRETRTYAY